MDQLLEIAAFIVTGGLGVLLLRFLKPKSVEKEHQAVVIKVEEKQKEVEVITQQIKTDKEETKTKIEELEVEKNKDVSTESLVDFFDKRGK